LRENKTLFPGGMHVKPVNKEEFAPFPRDHERFEIRANIHGSNSPVPVNSFKDEKVRATILNPEEIIIADETITIWFSYPLKKEVYFRFSNPGGFNRLNLFESIYEGYVRIYCSEDAHIMMSGKKKYGIWGHCMDDLIIESIRYDPQQKLVAMFIGS